MRLDNFTHQGKTQPGAAIFACGRVIQLMKWFEQFFLAVGWNAYAYASICNGELNQVVRFRRDAQDNVPASGRELDSVIEKL